MEGVKSKVTNRTSQHCHNWKKGKYTTKADTLLHILRIMNALSRLLYADLESFITISLLGHIQTLELNSYVVSDPQN